MVIETEGGDDDLPPETMPEDLPSPSLEEKASLSEPSDVPSEATSSPHPETIEEVPSVEPSEEKASETIPEGSSVQLPEQIPIQQPPTFTGDLSFLGPAYASVPPPGESDQPKKKKGAKGKKASVEKPKKQKGPKKKRLSKKERARLAAEQAEQERLERERERIRLIQEEKEGIKADCQAAEDKKRHDAEEQESRLSQLRTTFEFIDHYESRMFEIKLENRIQEEWKRYLKCDGLPDPASVQQMHIYLHMWQNDNRLNDIDHVLAKSDEVIRFTEVLDELIENPLDNSERKVELWKEIRNSIRTTLQQHLDTATYILLRCVERNLTFITDQEVFYERITPHFTLCLWGILPPPPTYSPEEQPKKIKSCSFDQLGVMVQTPESLGDVDFILRALHLKYDHYSDRCPSWPTPSLPEAYTQDLNDVVQAEWEAKKILQINVDEEFDQRIKRRQMIIAQYAASAKAAPATSVFEKRADKKGSKSASNPPEPEPDYPALLQEMHDLPPIKTALERYREEEDEVAKLLKVDLLYSCNDDELNLRKFRILNGVLFVDMLRQLPQPRELRKGHVITLRPEDLPQARILRDKFVSEAVTGEK